jgi:hypothetical protein
MKQNALFAGLNPKLADLRPIERRKARRRHSDPTFTDFQVLTLVNRHGQMTITKLHQLAVKEMPKFFVDDKIDYVKVLNSVNRLESNHRVRTKRKIVGATLHRVVIPE